MAWVVGKSIIQWVGTDTDWVLGENKGGRRKVMDLKGVTVSVRQQKRKKGVDRRRALGLATTRWVLMMVMMMVVEEKTGGRKKEKVRGQPKREGKSNP